MTATIEMKLRALRRPGIYEDGAEEVHVIETHMSWVFLVGQHVYKLKKPVRFPFLDFTALKAREENCLEEVRLNRRLAPHVYLGVVPLVEKADGSLSLGGEGEVIDWLVRMRRLPQDRMLSSLLGKADVSGESIDRLCEVLADFYRKADRSPMTAEEHFLGLEGQQALNRQVLCHRNFDIDSESIRHVLNRIDECMHCLRPQIEARVSAGRYIEGHGDLRPEHVCLTEPIAIIDCLEFSYQLRLVDPFDEIAFLGMECAFLGVPGFGERLLPRMSAALNDAVSTELFQFYSALRATMRARMALGHLVYDTGKDRATWENKTDRYIAQAKRFLAKPELTAVCADAGNPES